MEILVYSVAGLLERGRDGIADEYIVLLQRQVQFQQFLLLMLEMVTESIQHKH